MKKIVLFGIIIALFITACTTQKPIGGETDEHGCLVAAGYSWDADVGACTRQWELDEEEKAVAKMAVAPLSYPVTVVSVEKADCEDCYVVSMQKDSGGEVQKSYFVDSRFTRIDPENISSFQECVLVGNPVMESYPRQCHANGKTFTETIDMQSRCSIAGGTWLPEFNECEYISRDVCENYGGEFNECASACRHTGAEICTMQCVPVCSFRSPDSMTEQLCSSSGGNWDECSNKCMIMNQGKEGMGCTLQCEALCECGGIAGFGCPDGYDCVMPGGIADALGYCSKE